MMRSSLSSIIRKNEFFAVFISTPILTGRCIDTLSVCGRSGALHRRAHCRNLDHGAGSSPRDWRASLKREMRKADSGMFASLFEPRILSPLSPVPEEVM